MKQKYISIVISNILNLLAFDKKISPSKYTRYVLKHRALILMADILQTIFKINLQ